MKGEITAKEGFRKSFVLVMALAYAAAFVALIGGFLEALLLAVVFSGIVYPLYLWFQKYTGGRKSLSSMLTLTTSLLVIIIPFIFLLGLVAEQAVNLGEMVKPWVTGPDKFSFSADKLPQWFPFADKLAPYSAEISAKIAQLAGTISVFLASSLARISEGAAIFFLNLFVMLYGMFVFLMSGPTLVKKLMSYSPLSESDQKKMVEVGLSVSRATVKGTIVIGIIQGVLGGIGFAVAGIESAVFWSAVMAVLSVVPGIGSMLVWVPAVIYLMMTGEVTVGLILFIYCAGVVGTIDNFLRPVLVGRDAEMPDLLILLSTLGGLSLFGASGLVLGPILAALFLTVMTIYSEVFADWLEPDQVGAGSPSDTNSE
ncbi:MAG: AI-2E family transporter [Desulfopila sp.]|jgi:predicted PurR-regulated permease PerM|nr:AI-2E family transporter [Desulfopila sp.]